jgi:hypothetical protein
MRAELMQQVATQYKLTDNLQTDFEPQIMANEKINAKDISNLVGHLYDQNDEDSNAGKVPT